MSSAGRPDITIRARPAIRRVVRVVVRDWVLLRVLWHNRPQMFRGLALTLVLISVGISLPTRTG